MNRARAVVPAALLAVTTCLAGCSGGGDASEGAASDEDVRTAAGRSPDASFADEASQGTAGRSDGAEQGDAGAAAPRAPSVISTGTLTVESDDVTAARFDLGKVVDSVGGTIADEKTTAGEDGGVRMSRLVLRVPGPEFDSVLTDLADLGAVTASTRKAEDVTTEVIDTEARIRAQEQSLARVEVLFARADQIRDIVAIEAQLSRRQAELDSLKSQLAWLEDQTSLATLTVYLERAAGGGTAAGDETSAFLAGLASGWAALAGLGAGLARVSGALLPFAAAALLVGVPGWLLLRSLLAPLLGRLRAGLARPGRPGT